jgi:hypothetical protein
MLLHDAACALVSAIKESEWLCLWALSGPNAHVVIVIIAGCWAMLHSGARPTANHPGDSRGRGAQRSTIDPGSVSSATRFSVGGRVPVGCNVCGRHARSAGAPGFIRGALLHVGISVLCGEGLARTLPESRSVIWGAAAGLAIGVINVGVIGRRFPTIAALPLVPQLADRRVRGGIRICRRSITETARA